MTHQPLHQLMTTLIAPAALCRQGVLPVADGGGSNRNHSNDDTHRTHAVAQAAERLRQAMVAADRAVLEALVDDALSYGHSSGKVDTKASFVADLVSGASDFVAITITDETIAVAGPNAIVRHTLAATTNDGGKPGSVTLRVLQVWQEQQQGQQRQEPQQAGQWRLLARQAVRAAG